MVIIGTSLQTTCSTDCQLLIAFCLKGVETAFILSFGNRPVGRSWFGSFEVILLHSLAAIIIANKKSNISWEIFGSQIYD